MEFYNITVSTAVAVLAINKCSLGEHKRILSKTVYTRLIKNVFNIIRKRCADNVTF